MKPVEYKDPVIYNDKYLVRVPYIATLINDDGKMSIYGTAVNTTVYRDETEDVQHSKDLYKERNVGISIYQMALAFNRGYGVTIPKKNINDVDADEIRMRIYNTIENYIHFNRPNSNININSDSIASHELKILNDFAAEVFSQISDTLKDKYRQNLSLFEKQSLPRNFNNPEDNIQDITRNGLTLAERFPNVLSPRESLTEQTNKNKTNNDSKKGSIFRPLKD